MKRSRKKNGFALPMAIIAISGMLILLMGLLTILALERKASRSFADATRAELALQSGLADALATISPVASRDDTLVFRIEDPNVQTANSPVLQQPRFITCGSIFDFGPRSWRVLPFVSGVKELQTALPETGISTNASRPSVAQICTAIKAQNLINIAPTAQTLHHQPTAVWVNIVPDSPSSTNKTRFAWWVEDLSGRVDGKNAGSLPRVQSLDIRESGLHTIFAPAIDQDAGGPKDKLVQKRNSLRTAASIRTLLAASDADKIEPWITYSLPSGIRAAPIVPQGFGYPDAGLPPVNLNEMIEQRNVAAIAAQIDKNLPAWNTTRKGGFPAAENYTKTLAASFIDYADFDSDATIGTDFRGIDSYPFVNELYDRYEWTGAIRNQENVRVTSYVELWNPSDKKIRGTLEFENVNRHQIRVPLGSTHTLTDAIYPLSHTVELQPNQFLVINFGSKDYLLPTGVFKPSELPTLPTKESSFRLKWNGKIADMPRGFLERQGMVLKFPGAAVKWVGNSTCPSDLLKNQFADPRSNYYVTASWRYQTYAGNAANSSFGGRNMLRDEVPASYSQQLVSKWPDRGSDTLPGPKPGSISVTPEQLSPQYPVTESIKAPASISNSPDEKLLSLCEIGNTFDPAQWSSSILTSATPSSISGGGFTLAIGRPEFAPFDKEGLRAAQLLDIFQTPDLTLPPVPKVNINTAPREVLRTLVAGQQLTFDPNHPLLYPPKQPNVGDRFADAVIATRNRGPLRGLSDLNLIRANPFIPRNYAAPTQNDEPFFGSRLAYPVGSQPVDNWDDAGREELFRRVANLVTFQSKTFRIIIVGQVLDKSDNVIGRRSREVHVQIEPTRNADFTVNTSQPVSMKVVYSRNL